MADMMKAGISLAQWIALLDSKGVLNWSWFGDPLNTSLESMQDDASRQFLADLMRALINPGGPTQAFALSDFAWEPINIGETVGIGFAWNKTGDELVLGIAAGSKFDVEDQQIRLAVLAKLLRIANKQFKSELGGVRFDGAFPVPDFLKSGTLGGEINPTGKIEVNLTAVDTDGPNGSRTLKWIKGDPNLSGDVVAWDAARLAMFLLKAWIQDQSGEFFERVNEHLFPMLGEPESVIKPFPLFQQMQSQPDFSQWTNSVLTLSNNAQGALTFLWHLRALLTGNESASFFEGSLYFRLDDPAGPGMPILGSGQPVSGENALPPGAYVALKQIQGGFELSLLLRIQNKPAANVPLWRIVNGAPEVPDVPSGLADALKQIGMVDLPNGNSISITGSGTVNVTILNQTNVAAPPPLQGNYIAELIIPPSGKPKLKVTLPFGAITFPDDLNSPANLVSLILESVLKTSIAVNGNEAGPLLTSMIPVLKKGIAGTAPTPDEIVKPIFSLLSDNLIINAGPLTIKVGAGIIANITLKEIIFDKIPDALIYIGKLIAEAEFSLSNGSVSRIKLGIEDFRLAAPGGAKTSGLVASLLPDLTKTPGFKITVEGPPNNLSLSGGPKIPIQQTLGPLDLTALLIEISKNSLMLGIDLSFTLGPILVSVYELGVDINFNNGDVSPFLHGLGLSMDTSLVRLAGMFGEVDKGDLPSDYVGGAVVSVVEMFQLTAIGGYSQTAKGDASMFIFASLVAPLGGPPYFFITGIAGGFGFNRSLPPPGLLYEHPFLKVMNGDIDLSGDVEDALVKLSSYFAVSEGNYWIAAGIQFISFGFIYGKLVVGIQFGQNFALTVLGTAAFGIAPLVYFEIALEASADEEKFLLKAGISPNSYLIHPDIFSMRGDFGLGIWKTGDFIFSIGGFHPYFNAPQHYKDLNLNRVAVTASVWGWVRLSVECFFACTPQALMAGASVSLSAEFGDIAAGLDVYIDVLITWDPFYLWARMGVTVWFEFLGRHEVSVELEIWTPPFGGIATIDLTLVSFDVEFGEKRLKPPPPPLSEFITNQLGVPATGEYVARLATFNTDDAAGLASVELLKGRVSKGKLSSDSKQEGIDQAIPIRPEFSFTAMSKLPIFPETTGVGVIKGPVNAPLSGFEGAGTLTVTLSGVATSPTSERRLDDFFPAAEFGEKIKPVQADGARQEVASIDAGDAVVSLAEGFEIEYKSQPNPKTFEGVWLNAKQTDESLGEEICPLPLGVPPHHVHVSRALKQKLVLAQGQAITTKRRAASPPRRMLATQAIQARKVEPLKLEKRSGRFERAIVAPRLRGITLAQVPAGVRVIAPPQSQIRSEELYGVTLRVVAPRAAAPIGRLRLPISLMRGRVKSKLLFPPKLTIPPIGIPLPQNPNIVTLGAGAAAQFERSGGKIKRLAVLTSGRQIVRAIALSRFDEPWSDIYIAPGLTGVLPPLASRVVVIGEGADAAVSAGAAPIAEENVGVERDTALLAIGPRTFAGHGCTVRLKSALRETPDLFETLAGYELLSEAYSLQLRFPGIRVPSSLVVTVAPTTPQPGDAAEEVRWKALDATLSGLRMVVGADRVAFVMTAAAAGPWLLDLDIGSEWRLTSVALCNRPAATIAAHLRTRHDWDFIDDRLEQQLEGAVTTVTLEVVE